MPASKAPTAPTGSLGGGIFSNWSGVFDPAEHVSDLIWPTSVMTYSRMRRDPVLASVIAAYVMPITRAHWAVDPRGASPAMAKACADSLGLPLLGDDTPGPVRRRGVRWLDHVRLAVTGTLTWGHMPFEPVFEIRDGVALLSSLGERMPASITHLEVGDDGDLTSIWQQAPTAKDPRGALIPAARLLWYSRDKEGSAWQGQSILRPAFGPWLLKQDALRVHATSLRRFGAGTPIAKALPGTMPTPAQTAQAQAAVSNIRVGDSGGMTMPPGWDAEIKGVQGTFPSGIEFAAYLDQQMARAALTSMLDLGNTSNGSRALGETFADLLSIAQQAVADHIAEKATELCTMIVDYNEGTDALVPAVVVGDVAASGWALAEAVATLTRWGALTLDEGTENWLRDQINAPRRSGPPVVIPQAGARIPPAQQPDPNADPTLGPQQGGMMPDPPQATVGSPVAAAQQPSTDPTTTPATQATGTRPLTDDEQAAGLDPHAVQDQHDEILAALLVAWLLTRGQQRTHLLTAITAALATAGVAGLATVVVPSGDAATVLGDHMLQAAHAGAALATAEAARQGVALPSVAVDEVPVRARAAALADVLTQAQTQAAVRQALALAGPTSDPAAVAQQVGVYLDGLSDTWVTDQMGGAVHTGIGVGRAAVYAEHPPRVVLATEVLDRATCEPCIKVDGTDYPDLPSALEDYPTGRYRDCLGGVRCRGMLIAHYDDGSST